jgi:hypothetical protein
MAFIAARDVKKTYELYNKEIDGYLASKDKLTVFQCGRLYRILLPNMSMRDAIKDSRIKTRDVAPFIAGYLSVLWKEFR